MLSYESHPSHASPDFYDRDYTMASDASTSEDEYSNWAYSSPLTSSDSASGASSGAMTSTSTANVYYPHSHPASHDIASNGSSTKHHVQAQGHYRSAGPSSENDDVFVQPLPYSDSQSYGYPYTSATNEFGDTWSYLGDVSQVSPSQDYSYDGGLIYDAPSEYIVDDAFSNVSAGLYPSPGSPVKTFETVIPSESTPLYAPTPSTSFRSHNTHLTSPYAHPVPAPTNLHDVNAVVSPPQLAWSKHRTDDILAHNMVRSRQGSTDVGSPSSYGSQSESEYEEDAVVPPHMIVPSQQRLVDHRDRELRDLSSFNNLSLATSGRVGLPHLAQQRLESPHLVRYPQPQPPHRSASSPSAHLTQPEVPYMDHLPHLDGPTSPFSYEDSPSPKTPGFPSSSDSYDPYVSYDYEYNTYPDQWVQAPNSPSTTSPVFSSALQDALVEPKTASSLVTVSVSNSSSKPERSSRPRTAPARPNPSQTKRKVSPRSVGAPYPTPSVRRSSPGPGKKQVDKKPPLACLFCRGRKIACGAPSAECADKTCNQCARRQLKCEYPLESRRGMRKKKPASPSINSDGPKVTLKPVRSE